MFHSFHNCCQSFLFSHRHRLGLKRQMKKNAKMQDMCNKETKTTAASLLTIIQSNLRPGRVVQSVGHLTRKSGVLGSIPGLATYFRFSFRFFKKGSCQLLAKVCARSTG